jgi:hypothetical protein
MTCNDLHLVNLSFYSKMEPTPTLTLVSWLLD